MYAVTSQCICHLPGIRSDAFDVMSWVMAIGGKPLPITYRPVTAKPGQLEAITKALRGLDYRYTSASGA